MVRNAPRVLAGHRRFRILIGPLSSDPTESVSCVNAAFVEGLKERYEFLLLDATRKHGTTRQSMLNVVNLFYFARQCVRWLFHLVVSRPQIVHYAISSGWAMEKGLVFMKLARLFGAKTLGHLHSGDFIDFWRSLPAWRRRFAIKEIRRLDGLIVLSNEWKKAILRDIVIAPAKLHVVNNPISKDFEDAALQMPAERAQNRILALGIMDRKKGILDLLEAAKLIQHRAEFHLEIAGPERDPGIVCTAKEFVERHSLSKKVQLRSAVWGLEKIETFRKCSILVLPSHFENFPLVVIEAAAAGMAIISTPVGAVPEFFENGISALFVEPRHPDQIAGALLKLLQNPGERGRVAAAARHVFIKRLARSRIMDSLDRVYQNLLCLPNHPETDVDVSGVSRKSNLDPMVERSLFPTAQDRNLR